MKINELFPMLEDGWVWWDKTDKIWLYCPFEPVWNRYWKCYDAQTEEASTPLPYPFDFNIDPPENADEYVVIQIKKVKNTNIKKDLFIIK